MDYREMRLVQLMGTLGGYIHGNQRDYPDDRVALLWELREVVNLAAAFVGGNGNFPDDLTEDERMAKVCEVLGINWEEWRHAVDDMHNELGAYTTQWW